MKKFKYLFIYGLKKRIMTKAFVISNIILGVLILAVTLIPTFMSIGKNDAPKPKTELEGQIYYVDQSNDSKYKLQDLVFSYAKKNAEEKKYIWKLEEPKQYNLTLDEFYKNPDFESAILIVFKKDNSAITVDYYNNRSDETVNQFIMTAITELNRIVYLETNSGVNSNEINNTIINSIVDENAVAKEVEKSIGSAVSSILIVPMFILVIMGIQFIGTDIIEEKSSKAIEVIIASVPPKTHFYSKIASTISFLAIQIIIYISFAILGIFINSLIGAGMNANVSWSQLLGDKTQLVSATIIFTIVFALIGTLLYLIFGAFIASVAVNQEDYQQVQSPIMLILMIGYFASIAASSAGSEVFVKVLAYIPFTAALTAPGAYFSGTIGGLDILISLLILIATIGAATYFIAPVYKASILSYDEGKLFKRIKKIIKNSRALKKQKKN